MRKIARKKWDFQNLLSRSHTYSEREREDRGEDARRYIWKDGENGKGKRMKGIEREREREGERCSGSGRKWPVGKLEPPWLPLY